MFDHRINKKEKEFTNMVVPKSCRETLVQKGFNIEKEVREYNKANPDGSQKRIASATPAIRGRQEQREDKPNGRAKSFEAARKNATNIKEHNDPADNTCFAFRKGTCAHMDKPRCKHGRHLTEEEYQKERKDYKERCKAALAKIIV